MLGFLIILLLVIGYALFRMYHNYILFVYRRKGYSKIPESEQKYMSRKLTHETKDSVETLIQKDLEQPRCKP